MKLIVGTESTWSLRVWICAILADIDFELAVVDLSEPNYKATLRLHSPSGQVPVLIDKDLVIHDSLAIVEYLNELTKNTLYPSCASERATARSLCAEMHAGFSQLRSQCPFSSSNSMGEVLVDELLTNELARVEAIFERAKLPFMYQAPTAVDAFYAILAYRIQSYGIELKGKAADYQASLLNWDLLKLSISESQRWLSIVRGSSL